MAAKDNIDASCGGCEERWRGTTKAHCASCHCTFSTVGSFDQHRRSYKCLEPVEAGLQINDAGVWTYPRSETAPDYALVS